MSQVIQGLDKQDFYLTTHQLIFEAINASASVQQIDPNLLARSLNKDSRWPAEEDPYATVGKLWSEAATLTALEQYLTDVRACSHARQLAAIGLDLRSRAYETNGDPDSVAEALNRADETFRDLSAAVSPRRWKTISELTSELNDPEANAAPSVPTGFIDLDKLLQGGLRSKQLIYVAGRPGSGKSTFGVDIARYASIKRGIPGLFVSLEMSDRELTTRALSAEAGVALNSIRGETMTVDESNGLTRATTKIENAPLYILDSGDTTLSQLRSNIVAAHRILGIKFVVVDYIQLVSHPERNVHSREQEVSAISRAMKALAKDLDIVVLVMAQLNRGPESRVDKKPQIADLRESGQLENDGDIVLLVHRPDQYDSVSERAGEADLIVAKHRNGATDTITLSFQGHYSRFASLSRDDAYPRP